MNIYLTAAVAVVSFIFVFLIIAIKRARKTLRVSVSDHEAAISEITRQMKEQQEDHDEAVKALQNDREAEVGKLNETHQARLRRYEAIVDMEAELKGLDQLRTDKTERFRQECQAQKEELQNWNGKITALRSDYRGKKSTYDKLRSELAIFDERLAFAEMGVYEPHFDFGDSETFKAEIKTVRDAQKQMVKNKQAVISLTTWSVDGSKSAGATMINRAINLTLRAFNNECEAAIANTKWNNVVAMEKRIMRACLAIDKLNASNKLIVSDDYYELKIRELRLTHEYREKLKEEKEERAENARREREEKRLLHEAKAAEKEEARYQQLLAKARKELGVTNAKEDAERIRLLEEQLAQAHAKSERAKAMAEKNQSGFVYVISNVGSFGDDIVKIGLTRRLDPADRVRELGDASVPFLFDTHAMIYSETAPALEKSLHEEFAQRRVNAANMRKEFFRVTLKEVRRAVEHLAPDAEFHTDIDAQEYFETLSMRMELTKQTEAELPDDL